ncbi:MAG: hypothetical protein ACFE8M_02300 [Candidatus Hermodarchaeota archaeon]
MSTFKFKSRISKVFFADIDLSKISFLYLLFTFSSLAMITEALLFKYALIVEFDAAILFIILFIISISFLVSGILVDYIKNRTASFNYILSLTIIGLFLTVFSEIIGLLIILLTLPLLIVLWFTILVHETSILNRGRVTAFLIIISFIIGTTGAFFVLFEPLYNYLYILEGVMLILIWILSRKYKYLETEERLRSNKKYFKIIFEKHFFRYSSSFTILSFILGNLLATHGYDMDLLVFCIASFLYLIAAGWFLDNIGRKISIVLGILLLSFFLISSGSFIGSEYIFGIPKRIFLGIHYAFSITPLLLAIFTISGDFSIERGNLKFRGRINGLFMGLMFLGIIIGFVFTRWISDLPGVFIPNFSGLINSFALVILLVWMMSMKEILVSKERNWASTIKILYVFNNTGVCFYSYNFESKDQKLYAKEDECMDEDLVSSALTGVLSILSEITRSKKKLRRIEKDDDFLYFSYGKNHIATLISSMDLPVLTRKLDNFSKDFEDKFYEELKDFVGNMTPFESTKYLIKKNFTQKYAFLTE